MHFHSHQAVRLNPTGVRKKIRIRSTSSLDEHPRLSAVVAERRAFGQSNSSLHMIASQIGGANHRRDNLCDSTILAHIHENGGSGLYENRRKPLRSLDESENLLSYAPDFADPNTPPRGLIVANPLSPEFLRLNVGGQRFMLMKDTVLKRDTGRLTWMVSAAHEERMAFAAAYFNSTNEYFFERAPGLFHIIFQFYISGAIHQPSHLCPNDILNELEWWGIETEKFMASCCCIEDKNDLDSEDSESCSENQLNVFNDLVCGELRKKCWAIMEEPTSSHIAKVFATISVLFVLISISGLVLGSLPELQVETQSSKIDSKNGTAIITVEKEPHPYLQQMEYVCIIWFTFEYGMKMLVTADRRKTFFQLLNLIDLFAIMPFLIEMALMIFGIGTDQLRDLKGAFLVIRILRVLRVIRVLKLGRYSSGLQMFGKTLKASFRQLGMMAMVVMTGVIFFSTLVYFLEKDEPKSQFYSIPAACWWCIVTMTTVGYGDLTPVTIPGKLVATGAIACGVLVLALPITIIVDNFMKVAEGEREGIRRAFRRVPIITDEAVEMTENKKPHSRTEESFC